MAEDISDGDVTTEATVSASTSAIAKMNAAEDFIFCGSSIVPFCFPDSCSVEVNIKDDDSPITKADLEIIKIGNFFPSERRQKVIKNNTR